MTKVILTVFDMALEMPGGGGGGRSGNTSGQSSGVPESWPASEDEALDCAHALLAVRACAGDGSDGPGVNFSTGGLVDVEISVDGRGTEQGSQESQGLYLEFPNVSGLDRSSYEF